MKTPGARVGGGVIELCKLRSVGLSKKLPGVLKVEVVAVPALFGVGSLQPNQPGVLHVVVLVEVGVGELVGLVVVIVLVEVGSLHPHQPGVLHVLVLVGVDDEEVVEVIDVVVVISDPLLWKNFHSSQS